MAKLVNSEGHVYAGERRLLNFANKLRAAGDADPLEALMPSKPSDSKACLIANAVNFKSSVTVIGDEPGPKGYTWVMLFPRNMEHERIEEIAKAVKCKTVEVVYPSRYGACEIPEEGDRRKRHLALVLPQDIGNAAETFDASEGWTVKYNKSYLEAEKWAY